MEINGDKLPESYEKIRGCLLSGGRISFTIKRNDAKYFKKQTERIIQSERYMQATGFFNKVKSYMYLTYASLLELYLTTNRKLLKNPLLVYKTSWRYIGLIDGKDMPDGMAKIFFIGKRQSRSNDQKS